uniref:Uncharacterized protein n=1 Tax=Anisakis simplex TaxID=6269 RepID=A0A0M3JI50_ANISI
LRASVDASSTITRSRSAASGTRSHQRVRYRSSSSTSSNSAHSPSRHRKHLNRSASPIHYPSPLYLKTGADQAATNDVQIEQRRAHRAKRYFGIDPPREDCPVSDYLAVFLLLHHP